MRARSAFATYYNARVRLDRSRPAGPPVAAPRGLPGSSIVQHARRAAVPSIMHSPRRRRSAPAQTLTTCLAVDGSFVYWSDGTPAIMKVALVGGGAPQVARDRRRQERAASPSTAPASTTSTGADQLDEGAARGRRRRPRSRTGPARAARARRSSPPAASSTSSPTSTATSTPTTARTRSCAVAALPAAPVEVLVAEVVGNPARPRRRRQPTSTTATRPACSRARARRRATLRRSAMSTIHGNAFAARRRHLVMSRGAARSARATSPLFRTDGIGRTVVVRRRWRSRSPSTIERRLRQDDQCARSASRSTAPGTTALATSAAARGRARLRHIYFTDGACDLLAGK